MPLWLNMIITINSTREGKQSKYTNIFLLGSILANDAMKTNKWQIILLEVYFSSFLWLTNFDWCTFSIHLLFSENKILNEKLIMTTDTNIPQIWMRKSEPKLNGFSSMGSSDINFIWHIHDILECLYELHSLYFIKLTNIFRHVYLLT